MEEEFRRRRSISKDKIIFTRENRRKNSRTWKLQNQVVEKKEKKTVYSVSSSQNDDIRLFVLESISAFPFFNCFLNLQKRSSKVKKHMFQRYLLYRGIPKFLAIFSIKNWKTVFSNRRFIVQTIHRRIDDSLREQRPNLGTALIQRYDSLTLYRLYDVTSLESIIR